MAQTDWLNRVRERLAAEGITPSAHREAIDEIAAHLQDLHHAAIRHGKSPIEADEIVEGELARMGPLALAVAERAKRRQRVLPESHDWKSGLAADLKHAVRAIQTNRSFSAIVVVTLAIGIGACTAVFSIVNALLLGSLPFPNPGQLVMLWETDKDQRDSAFVVAEPVYQDWKRETRSFQSLGIWEYRTYNVASTQEPEQVQGIRASSSLFAVLGVPPALGRVFTAEEELPGHHVAVISDGVWRTHLGGRVNAIGSSLRLNGEAYEVIGVMPPRFNFPRQGNGIWVPFAKQDQDDQRGAHSFLVAARMRPDVTFEQARADIEQVGRALAQRYEENKDEGSTAQMMSEVGIRNLRAMLTALMGAVILVLVIACVNVANLQLGRAIARRREFALRLALGAGVGRVARQLFAESLVLAAGGGLAGLAVAWLAARAADLVLTPGFRALPYRGEVPITIDARVLLFAAMAALIAAALFGFAPMISVRGRDPQALLRDGERGSTTMANVARRLLVTMEVGLAIVVLCGAGLLVKSLSGLMHVTPGLDPHEVLTLQVSLPQADTYGPPQREAFCADLSRAAEGLPGVRRVGAISHLPLSGANAGRALTVEGYVPQANEGVSASYRLTCPGYFETLGIPIPEGRDFNHKDVTKGLPVVIINRAMARAYWKAGDNPIGRRLKLGGVGSENPWHTVVGITEDVRHFGLDSEPRREIFFPYTQAAWPTMTVVAKTVGDPLAFQSTLRDVIRRVDADLPVAQVQSMDTIVGLSVGWREMPMKLLTGFAIIGLLLASIGVYGVLAYYVSQRTREIGVRAALGATKPQLASLVVRQSLLPMIAGAVLGVAGSFATGRLLQDFLYQVQPGDPQVTAAIVVLLFGVGLLASWLPARRAASIDPMTALRNE
ncbi:MAG TPA: ABC transporter permease [Vicinamibacterales bacterium]|nr:ABC transporter permease [Vicinamibacterales bacterium]